MADGLRVGLLSLEAWDAVWRRNQHLAARLVRSAVIGSLDFVAPPEPGLALRAGVARPEPGIEVVTPPLVVPRRYGGHRVVGAWLRHRLRGAELLWVNDPVAGISAARRGVPVVYDVTDDWRSMPQDPASRARIVAAEDALASRATATVVCSTVLAGRWRDRYGIDATLVPNGVDVAAVRAASARRLDGAAPHAVYVGTVHDNRVDVALVAELARADVATVHLVGPDGLGAADRQRLQDAGVRLPGPVPSGDVPSWLVSADVLICPHRVDDFTLSLDAIKAHEYLATERPIVATPSCGFQELAADGLSVVGRDGFVDAVRKAVGSGPFARPAPPSWDDRAAAFGAVLRAAVAR